MPRAQCCLPRPCPVPACPAELTNHRSAACALAWQVTSYDGHTSNVTAVGFQKDGKWMYTGSEDGTIKIWDLRCVR